MKKIEIGCGNKKKRGYECCDIRNLPGVDYVCKADELPFENSSIDEIYSRHFIEHLTLREFLKTLSEWNRVLKNGGVIYIICPNLLWHLKQIITGSHGSFFDKGKGKNDRYWGFGSLFGWQQDKHDVHKFGYYFELIKDILENTGFGNVRNLTNHSVGYENSIQHLEVRAEKNSRFEDFTKSRFYNHFDVRH